MKWNGELAEDAVDPLRGLVGALGARARASPARVRARGTRPRRAGGGRGTRRTRDACAAGRPARAEDGRAAELTVREVEILRLVADGLSDSETAARLF